MRLSQENNVSKLSMYFEIYCLLVYLLEYSEFNTEIRVTAFVEAYLISSSISIIIGSSLLELQTLISASSREPIIIAADLSL